MARKRRGEAAAGGAVDSGASTGTLCGALFSIFIPITPRTARGEAESMGEGDTAAAGGEAAAAAAGGPERGRPCAAPHVHSRSFRSAASSCASRPSMRFCARRAPRDRERSARAARVPRVAPGECWGGSLPGQGGR